MGRHPSRLTPTLALAAFLVSALPVAAAKTDGVELANGDRLTGEIKKLERGKLSFKTDATGTIQIEWLDVASLESAETFEVELASGERFLGSLGSPAEEGRLEVVGEEGSRLVDLVSVVVLIPIEESFVKRLDGSIDLGFSFTEADDRTQLSFGADVRYRTEKLLRRVRLSSVQAFQTGVDETERQDLNLEVTRFLRRPNRLLTGFAQLQHNEELGIDLRALAGAAFGRHVIRSNTEILTLWAGAAVSRENLIGAEPSQENVEALFALGFESFRYDDPERDVDINLVVFPSLSDSGRVRAELDATIRWEIVNDFFFDLTLLGSYDNEPVSFEKTDVTLISSVGWSF